VLLGDNVLGAEAPDYYHLLPRFATQDVLQPENFVGYGNYEGFGSMYESYALPGEINGVQGNVVIGGHFLMDNSFYVTHALFEIAPF